MDLREFVTNETTGLVDRLIAAADAAVQKAKADAQGVIDAFRAQVDAERARVEVLARQMDAERTRAETLAGELNAQARTVTTLTSDLEAERDRAASLVAALESARDRAESLDAQLDSLTVQLEDERQRGASIASQLQAERAGATVRQSQLDEHAARIVALGLDLEAAQQLFNQADAARQQAESAVASVTGELQGTRQLLESARAEAIRASEAFQAEAAENALLRQAHETELQELHARLDAAASSVNALEASIAAAEASAAEAANASRAEIEELRGKAAALADERQALAAQLEAAEKAATAHTAERQALSARLEMADSAAGAHADERQSMAARVKAAEDAVAAMRGEVDEANAITDATSAQLSLLTKRFARLAVMLEGSAESLERLGAARTVTDVFAALVRELATEFDRVAIFRLKGTHLEGEHAAGLDEAVDVQKIVVPVALDSVISKALTSRAVEHAAKEQIGDACPPFGALPAFALAAPLLFDNDVLAIVYAESDAVVTEAHQPLSAILVRHANAVLASLAVELRTSRQLRDYARTLLHEAERMFDADMESQVPEEVRLERLRESIRFAHDLYGQRAALDGAPAMNLLDDEIGRLLREPPKPFISALESVLAGARDLRTSATA
jgi:hypothetical protein